MAPREWDRPSRRSPRATAFCARGRASIRANDLRLSALVAENVDLSQAHVEREMRNPPNERCSLARRSTWSAAANAVIIGSAETHPSSSRPIRGLRPSFGLLCVLRGVAVSFVPPRNVTASFWPRKKAKPRHKGGASLRQRARSALFRSMSDPEAYERGGKQDKGRRLRHRGEGQKLGTNERYVVREHGPRRGE